jgi:hypothetical protein
MKQATFFFTLLLTILSITLSAQNFCFSGFADNALRAPGAISPQFVTTADFNNDTWQDVAVANWGSNNVTIYLNKGDGTFLSGVNYTVNTNPRSIVVSDFNNDSKLDLAVASWSSNNISILLGNGNGTFANATNVVITASPTLVNANDVIAINYNGDANIDLAVVGYTSNLLYLFPGNGNGTFGTPITKVTGTGPRSLVRGKFNADNVDDIAVANQGTDNVSVFIASSNNYNNAINYAVGDQPFDVETMHINADGLLDLVVINRQANSFTFLQRTDNNGTFMLFQQLSDVVGTNPQAMQVANLDGNNANGLEIAYVNGSGNRVKILQRTSVGNYAIIQNETATSYFGDNLQSIALADFDKDGKQDYAIAAYNNNMVTVVPGINTTEIPVDKNYTNNVSPTGLAVADINNDGAKELVTISNLWPDLSVNKLNPLTKNWQELVLSPGLGSGMVLSDLKLADMNKDGTLDIVYTNATSATVHVSLLTNEVDNISTTTTKNVSGEPRKLVVADFDGDGNNDVATCSGGANVTVFLGDGNGGLSGGAIFQIGAGTLKTPRDIVTTDVNKDGKPDLITVNLDADEVTIFTNNGAGGFTQNSFAVPKQPRSIATGDFNGDGNIDFAIACLGANNITIRFGNGLGGVTNVVQSYKNVTEPYSLVAADFNADGKLDLAWANIYGGVITAEGQGNGQFSIFLNLFSPKFNVFFNTIVVTDFNSDGMPDIGGVSTSGNLAGVLYNQTAKITSLSPVLACTGTTVQLQAVANNTFYKWVSGQTTPAIAVTTSGNYQVTTSNISNSCFSNSKPVTVTFTNTPAAPTATVTQPTFAGGTGSIALSGNVPGLIYSFDNGQNYTGTNTKTGLSPGQYLVKVKDPNGCESPATTAIIKAFQTITFASFTATYGSGPIALNAVSSSGLPIKYTSNNPTVASITNSTFLTVHDVGTVTITASQAGDNNVLPSADVVHSIVVNPRTVNVIANSVHSKVFGNADPAAFTYTFNPPLVSGDLFTGALSRQSGENAGNYPITIGTLSAGNRYTINFTSANFTILVVPPVVTFTSSNQGVYGTTINLSVDKGGSAGAVTYTVTNGTGQATVAGNVLTLTQAGQVTVQAMVEVNGNFGYGGATQTFTITKATPVVEITSANAGVYGTNHTLQINKGGSTGAITYSVTNGTGKATVNGNTLTPTQAGQVSITATVAADINYNSTNTIQAFTTN